MKKGCIDHFNSPRGDCLCCEIVAVKVQRDELRQALEPGKAPAIVEGMFRECERLGIYKPTAEHALSQMVKEIERMQAGEKWAASMFCQILAVAISGVADSAIVADQKMDATHALGAVKSLAEAAKKMRADFAEMSSKVNKVQRLLTVAQELDAGKTDQEIVSGATFAEAIAYTELEAAQERLKELESFVAPLIRRIAMEGGHGARVHELAERVELFLKLEKPSVAP